jgi:hypothetical protein
LDQPRAPDEWDVFISYSRKDHEFASRLHAVLNVYQPPRGLPVPQRRLQVFLDTSDYSGPDYKPTIQQHLKNSSKIIVICSPNAVGSRFVGPEIDDILTAEDVVRRIAAECAYLDERGGVGIRLEPAAAIVRRYGEQFRRAPRRKKARSPNPSPLL